MKKTNRYFQMHTALIVNFVTLFLEATTHNVTESFLSNDNKNHFLVDLDLINDTLDNNSTNLLDCFSTYPIEFHIFLLFLWIGSFFYALCLMNWYYNTIRQRSFVEILFFICCPFVYLPFVQTVWHRIMQLMRPRANNENRYAVIRTARNINSPVRETEDYSRGLRESRLLGVD